MLKYFSFLCLLLVAAIFLTLPVQGQATSSYQGVESYSVRLPKLIPFRAGNLWGYADSTGAIKIQPKYKQAEPFRDGAARVEGNFWNLIDENGNELVKQQFRDFSPTNKGLIVAQDPQEQVGVIDLKGKEIVPARYNGISIQHLPDLKQTMIQVTVRVKPSEEILKQYGNVTSYAYGLYDAKGKNLLPAEYAEISYLADGLYRVYKDKEWALLNVNNSQLLPLKSQRPASYKEGLLMLCQDQRCGFADKTGKEIIPLEHNRLKDFSEGLAGVVKDGKWGFMNKQGNMVIQPKYDEIRDFHNGVAIVKKGGLSGLIDKQGKELTDFSHYELSYHPYGQSMYKLKNTLNATTAYYNVKTGMLKVASGYNYQEGFSEGLAQVINKDYKRGYADEAGNVVISFEYTEARPFSKGLAAVRKNDSWGVIDKTGRIIIPLGFRELEILDNDVFKVGIKTGYGSTMVYGLINRKGEEILPVKYSLIEPFKNGIAPVLQNKTSGMVSITGKVIVPLVKLPAGYKICGTWENGIIKICTNNRSEDAYIDKYGRVYSSK